MTNRFCSGCNHEAEEGETFTISVDPDSEWWLTLSELPQYCDKCQRDKEPNPTLG